jgi:hypothetical protein
VICWLFCLLWRRLHRRTWQAPVALGVAGRGISLK